MSDIFGFANSIQPAESSRRLLTRRQDARFWEEDKTVKLWNVQTRQELATLKGHDDIVDSVAFSPDGKTLASGSRDNTVKL